MVTYLKNFLRRTFGVQVIKVPKCLPAFIGEGCLIDASVSFEGHVAGIKIGRNVRIGPGSVLRCEDEKSSISIGDNCVVMPYVILQSNTGGWISIGSDCSINPFSVIYGGYGGAKIGNFVRIATQTVITPTNHNFGDPHQPITKQGYTSEGIVIADDVWIGAGVKILDGCTVGQGSVIGAGSVVTKDIETMVIAVGVPARAIGRRL